jgi:hypothetical protein
MNTIILLLYLILPNSIKGVKGSTNTNSIYVSRQHSEDSINKLALLPNLSSQMPIMGIRKDDMKKGRAMAIPTLCCASIVTLLLYL